MKIGEIRQKFKELDFRQITGDALEATKSEIVEYQKAQMLHGEDVNGGKIGKYKSKDYARRKFNMNPLAGYGNVDLRYKGPFQHHIVVKFFSSSLSIFSTDWKFEKLTEQYGEKIFGLNAKFIADYTQIYLASEIMKRIKQKLYGL